MVIVKRKNGHEYTKLPMESRKKPAWARVYTLDEGSKWTIFTLATELQKRIPYINISLPYTINSPPKNTIQNPIQNTVYSCN